MQKFNGLTMGMSNYYKKVNYDTETVDGSDSSESIVNYETELPKVQRSVDALKDDVTVGDDIEKEALNNAITRPFIKGINDYLKDKEEIKSNLINSIRQALVKYPEEKSLKSLETALVSKPEEISDKNIPQPEFKLDGLNTGEIKDMEDGGKESISSYIKKEKPEDDKQVPDNFKLYKTKAEALNLSDRINNLLKNEKLKENDNLKKTKDLVENINKILNNLTKDNIKLLQNFIFNNLEEDKKKQFKEDNYYNEKSNSFDGRLGKSTLGSLNDLGKKIEEYVSSLEKSNPANPESQEAEDPFKNIKVKGKIESSQCNNAENLFLGLNGATATFEGGGLGQSEITRPQEVKVKVKNGEKEKIFTIVASAVEEGGIKYFNLERKKTGTTSEVVLKKPEEPLELKGKKYPVANDDLAKKYGQVLYQINPLDNNSSNEVGGTETIDIKNNLPGIDANGDRGYLMHTEDGDYKVKLDANGNLKPLVENFDGGAKVLIKNNQSCINYLQNKIPSGLPGDPKIYWNSKMEDYVIRSKINGYKEVGITIEPMELEGHGVSSVLSELLIMMNFVNYLRFNKKIDNIDFNDKDDPDLRLNGDRLEVRVNKKSNRTYDEDGNVIKKGKWYSVNMDRFGFNLIRGDRENKLKNLIKFNNGEDWRDDWDKKEGNKYYKKMDLEGVSFLASSDEIANQGPIKKEAQTAVVRGNGGETTTVDINGTDTPVVKGKGTETTTVNKNGAKATTVDSIVDTQVTSRGNSPRIDSSDAALAGEVIGSTAKEEKDKQAVENVTEVKSNGEAINETKFEELCKKESLTGAEAKQIVDYAKNNSDLTKLELNNLKSLSDDVAKELSNCSNIVIKLNGLGNINSNTIYLLSGGSGRNKRLIFGGLKDLTPDVANALVSGNIEHFLPLNGISSLTPDVASALASGKVSHLSLSGLESISSPEVASALANGNIKILRLNGISSLTPDVANALAGGNIKTLRLSGINSLTPEVASALASGNVSDLSLNGLKSISSPDVAKALAGGSIENIQLNGLESISSPDVAKALAGGSIENIQLNGLKSLDGVEGSSFNGIKLDVSQIKNMDFNLAKKLASYNGLLEFWDLKKIDDGVASALAEHEGPLYLFGLREMDQSVADVLANGKFKTLGIGLVKDLNLNKVKSLANYKGNLNLCLYEHKLFNESVAEALASHEGPLCLQGLESINVDAAKKLAKHKGELYLHGLYSITPELAEALASHEGPLELPDVINDGSDGVKLLMSKKGVDVKFRNI